MQRADFSVKPDQPFDEEAGRHIRNLKLALGHVIESLPGERVTRPSELGNLLVLDTMLAWKIWKVINDDDPYDAALYAPGANGMRQFLRAARKRQASEDSLKAAQRAYDAFQVLIRSHAGDRKSFDMMLAGHVTADRARVDLEHRRGAFQHLSYVWGVQARTQINTLFLRPSATPGYFDAAAIRGFVDLRRIRPNVPWRIARCYTVDDAGALQTAFVREPLDSTGATRTDGTDLPLLRDFCSQPLPECRRVDGPHGQVEYQLVEGAVGNAGLLTCMTGEVIRAAEPYYRDAVHQELVLQAYARTPCEMLLYDILVDRRLFPDFQPVLKVYSALFLGDLDAKPAECDRIPLQETIAALGPGIDGLQTEEAPRYPEMIAYALQRLAWNAADFDAYRVRLEFPPIPASVRIYHDLSEAPVGSHP